MSTRNLAISQSGKRLQPVISWTSQAYTPATTIWRKISGRTEWVQRSADLQKLVLQLRLDWEMFGENNAWKQDPVTEDVCHSTSLCQLRVLKGKSPEPLGWCTHRRNRTSGRELGTPFMFIWRLFQLLELKGL